MHERGNPVHVTLRREKGLPSLRSQVVEALLRRALDDTGRARQEDFRVAEYSIQADHLHLVVEADEHEALSRGMRSLAIRIALRLNRLLRRRGRVWAHRHHRHELLTPSEVRHALVYVLNNYAKHGEPLSPSGDACSSARWFTGWIHAPPRSTEPPPTRPALTWLLREGWLTVGHGPLHIGELPRAARR